MSNRSGRKMNPGIRSVDLDDEGTFDEIEKFCYKAGLPFFVPVRTNLLAQFIIRDAEGRLSAAARLEYSFSHPFVEEVAVREDLRGTGLGRMVVEAVLKEARRREIETIWAMARAPDFFRKMGFEEAQEKDLLAQLLGQCDECKDYRSICNPMLMKKHLME